MIAESLTRKHKRQNEGHARGSVHGLPCNVAMYQAVTTLSLLNTQTILLCTCSFPVLPFNDPSFVIMDSKQNYCSRRQDIILLGGTFILHYAWCFPQGPG
ncbi:hypothetical protein A0H81_05021 [Grifola frondosa]|uniref:Uncharacterized protein n=1 Tax=Grifola frondosa TaxID=5627 RepID=A0A1C7MF74_GRIFR|nr:hypothetical protein A0H81_05021 [Grifola frondosa]